MTDTPSPIRRDGRAEVHAGALGIRGGQFHDVRRRFLRRRVGVVGLVMVSAVVLTALLAPALAPQHPEKQDLAKTQAGPSRHHLLGTDELGRDQLSRIIHGSRPAVAVGVTAVLLSMVVGMALGALAGFLGRRWDAAIMRVADAFLAFPVLIGAMVIVVMMGRGLSSLVIAIAVFGWATVARLLRSSVLSVRESAHVEAARSLGASKARILLRHVLPNAVGPVIVYGAMSVGLAVASAASLSFLGLGVNAATADWGNMVAAGQKFFGYKDFLWISPAVAIVFTVMGFVLLGDGLRDALDPRVGPH